MVLPIIVLPATPGHGMQPLAPPDRRRPVELWRSKSPRRSRPRWLQMARLGHRQAALRHWTPVTRRCAPPPLPPLAVCSRSSAGYGQLLGKCEALLRQLLRRRSNGLGLRRTELAPVALAFNGNTLRTQDGSTAARAFVLVSMYWNGCRHPLALFAHPLHPPTGLVRWLSSFTVQDQVDHGMLLLARLAQEEQRMFEFALRLTERIDAMTANRARGFALLPELLRLAESQEINQ